MIRGYLALVLFAVSVTACAPPPEESCSASVAEGYALPAATIADCSGAEVKLSELTAAHDVTYITFAAGWCTACSEEIPALNALAASLADEEVAIVQILIEGTLNGEVFDDTASALQLCEGWSDAYDAEFPILIDPDQVMLCEHFGEAVGQLPVHLLVTQDGTVVFRRVGALPDDMHDRITNWL